MPLGDIIIEKRITAEEVHAALCRFFSMKPAQVFVHERIDLHAYAPPPPETSRVACAIHQLRDGEFLTQMEFHPQRPAHAPMLTVGRKLAAMMECRCLIRDEEYFPDSDWSYILAEPDFRCRQVFVDPDQDANGLLFLAPNSDPPMWLHVDEPADCLIRSPKSSTRWQHIRQWFGFMVLQSARLAFGAIFGLFASLPILILGTALFGRKFWDPAGTCLFIGFVIIGGVWFLVRCIRAEKESGEEPTETS